MKQRIGRINRWSLLWVALFPVNIILAQAPSGMDPLSSLSQIPTQQFVTADDTSITPTDSTAATTAPAATPVIPLAPNPAVSTVIPLAPNTVQPNLPLATPLPGTQMTLPGTPQSSAAFVQTLPVPSTSLPLAPTTATTTPGALPPAPDTGGATPLSPLEAAEVTTPEFTGGINKQSFIYCSRLTAVTCNRAGNNASFRSCLSSITLPACKPFMVFAALTDFNVGDVVDEIEHYTQGNLDLIHVKRYGMNYPGDYYAIGGLGTFYNITTGPEAQAINISASADFPEISQRFPQAQLWSFVESPPKAESLAGSGMRLLFRFKILNGCATCETAGFANIAYDFSGDGILKQAQLLSLSPQ